MTRITLVAFVIASLAGTALADGTYVLNDKKRPIFVPTPAAVTHNAAAEAKPAAASEAQPYSLTGSQPKPPVRVVNDKNRPI